MTWPVGTGPRFKGVYDRKAHAFLRFEAGENIGHKAGMQLASLSDPKLKDEIGDAQHEELVGELELLDAAGNAYDREAFLAGKVTPVFFGSAMNNFGVEPFLEKFIDLCPSPRTRHVMNDVEIPADATYFTGFVFKIQANMDPQHRDRIAFVRICSGKFTRGMEVKHVRTKKKLTLSRSLNFLAQERVTVDEAYSGDIVGVWDPGVLRIGDALTTGPDVEFDGIPRFSPEYFVRVRSADPMKRKQLKKGLEELSDEGAVLLLYERDENDAEPILGTVGPLQFDVVQYRLKAEYGVAAIFDRLSYNYARWIEGTAFDPKEIERRGSILVTYDIEARPILLFDSEWVMNRTMEKYPQLTFIAAAQPGRRKR